MNTFDMIDINHVIIRNCTVLYCTVVYCTVLYCTVVYCTAVLYYVALCLKVLKCFYRIDLHRTVIVLNSG